MKHSPLPREVLVRRLVQLAGECGAVVHAQKPVQVGGAIAFADLCVEKHGYRIVGQLVPSPRVVGMAIAAAVALGAQLLLVVTPDAPAAHACRRQLRRCPEARARLNVIACPLGAALEILRQTLTNRHIPGAQHPPVQANPEPPRQ